MSTRQMATVMTLGVIGVVIVCSVESMVVWCHAMGVVRFAAGLL